MLRRTNLRASTNFLVTLAGQSNMWGSTYKKNGVEELAGQEWFRHELQTRNAATQAHWKPQMDEMDALLADSSLTSRVLTWNGMFGPWGKFVPVDSSTHRLISCTNFVYHFDAPSQTWKVNLPVTPQYHFHPTPDNNGLTRMGPAYYYALKFLSLRGDPNDRVFFVQTAVSGIAFEPGPLSWAPANVSPPPDASSPAGDLMQFMHAHTQQAKTSFQQISNGSGATQRAQMLWLGGESSATMAEATFQGHLSHVINGYRNTVADVEATAPVLLLPTVNPTTNAWKAQATMGALVPKVHPVSNSDLFVQPGGELMTYNFDGIHYTAFGYRVIGASAAAVAHST